MNLRSKYKPTCFYSVLKLDYPNTKLRVRIMAPRCFSCSHFSCIITKEIKFKNSNIIVFLNLRSCLLQIARCEFIIVLKHFP